MMAGDEGRKDLYASLKNYQKISGKAVLQYCWYFREITWTSLRKGFWREIRCRAG